MTEIPPEDQIEFLLSTGRIKEAKSLFLMKDSKGANFQQRNKEFNINAGWVSLIKQLDFNDVILYFKDSDLDPRYKFFYFTLQRNHSSVQGTL